MKKILLFLVPAIWLGFQDSKAQIVSPGVAYPGQSVHDRASGPYFGQSSTGSKPKRFASPKTPVGDYLGEIPPDTIPKIFARDFISSAPNIVYSCTFSPDGTEFYYSNLAGSYNHIWKTERVNDAWTKPAVAPFPQSPWTIEPNFSPDGTKLFFVSDMPDDPPGPPYNPALRIWCLEKTGNEWSDPKLLQGPFSDNHKMYPTVASNGNLYFTEVIGDHSYIYKSEWNYGGGYQPPVKLDSAVNRFFSQAHPFIAPDESFLIFDASENGPPDWKTYLYLSYRNQDETWKEARKLPAVINATGSEYCGYPSPDQKYLFFARNTPEGGTYLWWVRADQIFHPAGINETGKNPGGPVLKQNYPNPCSVKTTFEFSLTKREHIQLKITDLSGRDVKIIADEVKDPGRHLVEAALDDLSAGLYFCTLSNGIEIKAIKIVID